MYRKVLGAEYCDEPPLVPRTWYSAPMWHPLVPNYRNHHDRPPRSSLHHILGMTETTEERYCRSFLSQRYSIHGRYHVGGHFRPPSSSTMLDAPDLDPNAPSQLWVLSQAARVMRSGLFEHHRAVSSLYIRKIACQHRLEPQNSSCQCRAASSHRILTYLLP